MEYSSDPNIRKVEKARYKAKQLSLISENKKWCEKCKVILPLEEFCKNSSEPLRFNKMCKKCYHEHYYLPNRERHISNAKKWQKENPERVREIAKTSQKKRKKEPSERMIHNVTRIISVYGSQLLDDIMPQEYFGCSYEDIKIYIMSLWTEGMSWENYGRGKGKWQIDHIIPIMAFDFTKPNHMKWCCNYRNLRPIWHEQNMEKRDKLPNGMSVNMFRRNTLPHEYKEYIGKLIETQQDVSSQTVIDSYGSDQKVIYVYI